MPYINDWAQKNHCPVHLVKGYGCPGFIWTFSAGKIWMPGLWMKYLMESYHAGDRTCRLRDKVYVLGTRFTGHVSHL